MSYPERVYTTEEVQAAKNLVCQGYKHNLTVEGDRSFTQKVNLSLDMVKTAGYIDFLQTYIRKIFEIDGITQLRETEVAIWANKFAVDNPVDFASLLVQKAHHMKEYLDGELYYGGNAEKRSVDKRIEFLKMLKEKSIDNSIKEECDRLLEMWKDSSLV
jgi:hypothetical protein